MLKTIWVFRKDTGEILQKWSEYQPTITLQQFAKEILRDQRVEWEEIREKIRSGERPRIIFNPELRGVRVSGNRLHFECFKFESWDNELFLGDPGEKLVGFIDWDPEYSGDKITGDIEFRKGWGISKYDEGFSSEFSTSDIIKWIDKLNFYSDFVRSGIRKIK